jgi:hypothetical protein
MKACRTLVSYARTDDEVCRSMHIYFGRFASERCAVFLLTHDHVVDDCALQVRECLRRGFPAQRAGTHILAVFEGWVTVLAFAMERTGFEYVIGRRKE